MSLPQYQKFQKVRLSVCVSCAQIMSRDVVIDRVSVVVYRLSGTDEEASPLLQCGSFWPDSLVDKSLFVTMLLGMWEHSETSKLNAGRRSWLQLVLAIWCGGSTALCCCLSAFSLWKEPTLWVKQEDERLAPPSELLGATMECDKKAL
eukprot:2768188-Amphidinium_carterae.1